MYICLCNSITDHKLKKLIKGGNKTFKELQQELKVGMSCGSCLEEVYKLVNKEQSENKPAVPCKVKLEG